MGRNGDLPWVKPKEQVKGQKVIVTQFQMVKFWNKSSSNKYNPGKNDPEKKNQDYHFSIWKDAFKLLILDVNFIVGEYN